MHAHTYISHDILGCYAWLQACISSDQGAQIFQKSRNHLTMSSSSSPSIVLLSTPFPFLPCAPGLPQDGGNWFLQNLVPV